MDSLKLEVEACHQHSADWRLFRPLSYLSFAVMGGVAAYEGLKMVLFPHLTIWVSHLMTIGVSGVAAVVAGYFVLQRHSRLLERPAVELRERERAEAALIEERHLLHTLMDNLPDLIYFKDCESRFSRIDLALSNKLGLSYPDQAVGKTDFDFFSAEHAKEFFKDEEEIIRTGQPIVAKEEKVAWPDGHVTWDATTKMPLRGANGNIIGTFGISRDITERKRAEELLQEYERAVEGSDELIVVVDREYRYLLANRAFLDKRGLNRGV